MLAVAALLMTGGPASAHTTKQPSGVSTKYKAFPTITYTNNDRGGAFDALDFFSGNLVFRDLDAPSNSGCVANRVVYVRRASDGAVMTSVTTLEDGSWSGLYEDVPADQYYAVVLKRKVKFTQKKGADFIKHRHLCLFASSDLISAGP